MINFKTKKTTKFIVSTSALALLGGMGLIAPSAFAQDACVDGSGANTVQCGDAANASGVQSTAVGDSAIASGDRSVTLGHNSQSTGFESVALGRRARATDNGAIAIGGGNLSTRRTLADGEGAIAIGSAAGAFTGAEALGDMSIAIGGAFSGPIAAHNGASATSSRAIAIGGKAFVSSPSGVAVGHDATAGGNAGAIAIGTASHAIGLSTAVGASADASVAGGSVAIGSGAEATGITSTAIGGHLSVSLGDVIASAKSAIAIGGAGSAEEGAAATAEYAIAIGASSKAAFDESVAIGRGAETTEDGQIILGAADNFTIMGNGDMALGTGAPAAFADLQISRDNGVIIHLDDNTPSTGIPWNIQNTAGEFRLTTPPGGAAEKEFVLDADGNLAITGDMSSAQSLLSNNGAVFNKLTDTSTGTVWNFANIGSEARIVSPTVAGVEFKMDVNGNVTIMGSITTGGMVCAGGCDAVFSADYDLPSIEEHAKSMFANKHLPAIGATSPNTPVNLSDQYGNLLNELEKAHIYIAQQQEGMAKMKAEQKTEMAEVKTQSEARYVKQQAELLLMKQQITFLMNK